MSLMSIWGQLVESASGTGGTFASARKISYMPQFEADADSDSDIEERPGEASYREVGLYRLQETELLQSEANAEAPSHLCSLGCSISAWHALREASAASALEAQQLISIFCGQTSVTRVAPTEKELESLWSMCSALACSLPDAGKAKVYESIFSTLCETLSGDLDGHEWKPQFRVLCVLQFYYCKGGVWRAIAQAAIAESSELLHYFSTQVTPCREQAFKVMQLSQMAAVVPSGEEIVMGNDGDIFVPKASDGEDKPVPDDDRDTSAGDQCSLVEASDSQDEQFVASWPSSFQTFRSTSASDDDDDDVTASLSAECPAQELAPIAAECFAVEFPSNGAEGPSVEMPSMCAHPMQEMLRSPSEHPMEDMLRSVSPASILELPCVKASIVIEGPGVDLLTSPAEHRSVDVGLLQCLEGDLLKSQSHIADMASSTAELPTLEMLRSSSQNETAVVEPQKKPRKMMAAIPWGIEDTLPEPVDPFAGLAKGALVAFI